MLPCCNRAFFFVNLIEKGNGAFYNIIEQTNSTFSRLQRACSSMTTSVQGKAVVHLLHYSTERPAVQFDIRPLDGPFNQEIPPWPLFRHCRHHCPQNGWQHLEIPGCVTTPRCTRCARFTSHLFWCLKRQRTITSWNTGTSSRFMLQPDTTQAAGLITSRRCLATSSASEAGNNYLWLFFNFQENNTEWQGKLFQSLFCWLFEFHNDFSCLILVSEVI